MLIRKLIFNSSNVAVHSIVPLNNQLKLMLMLLHIFSKSIGISTVYDLKVNLQIQTRNKQQINNRLKSWNM